MSNAKAKKIEEIYPLTSLQQGMLFHSLHDTGSAAYFQLMTCRLEGVLDETAFAGAWQALVDRHSILRTSFVWKGQREPVQVVNKEAKIPWARPDWRGFTQQEQKEKLVAFCAQEQREGFVLSRAPLMRVATIRLSDNSWQFVWCHHHLLLDGWSLPLLMQEFFTLYRAQHEGIEAHLPPTRPFSTYVSWLKKQNKQEAEAFWRKELANLEASGGFSLPEPSEKISGHREVTLSLSKQETDALVALNRRLNITQNTLLQGAWAIVLARYAGEEEALFGVTVALRPPELAGIERMIGLCINTVPLRVALPPEELVGDWLKGLQLHSLEAREFEYCDLAEIHSWSGRPKGEDLFESILVFENYPLGEAVPQAIGDLSVHDVQAEERNNYPLTLIVVPGKEIFIKFSYDASRFSPASMQRMLAALRSVLAAMTQESSRLKEIPLLASDERALLFDGALPKEKPENFSTVLSGFEKQAALSPQAIALVCAGRCISYGELEANANRLAHYLRKQGVQRETLVGLFLNRSAELIVAILGILKAGGAYVPIDPETPEERLAYIVEDSRIPILLTQSALSEKLNVNLEVTAILCLDELSDALLEESASVPAVEHVPEQAMYVIYTSGSTGKPKGCVITHRNVLRLFTSTEHWFGFGAEDVWTLFHSQAFDFSVWEIWGALFYGGRLVVVPHFLSRNPKEFHELLLYEKVTVLNQTPSAFRLLDKAVGGGNKGTGALRLVIFGGEALELKSLLPWFERHGDVTPRLVNMFGITETTVHVTYRPVTKKDAQAAGNKSWIGVPIPDLALCILDRYGHLAPVGMPGELHVGGAGLAREYLNRPDLTRERFITAPFVAGSGVRLYRTGDLVRRSEDGDLEYLGRIDNQVKIRGFRIELGEIETALAKHPAVKQAVVLAREDQSGSKRLVAYMTGTDKKNPALEELHAFLSEWLPGYMLPSAIVSLEEFPLTANGKIDFRALPDPEGAASLAACAYVAPRTENESILAEIWSQVLGVERVGIEDNFFVLGGDSIRSISVVSLAWKKGINLTLQQIFKARTIKSLAQELEGAQEISAAEIEISPFGLIPEEMWGRFPASIEDAYPLTRLQAGMLFHSQYENDSTLYHDLMSYHLRMPLVLPAFEDSLRWLAQRHSALRTSFDFETFGTPLQLVHKEPCYFLKTADISHLGESAQVEIIDRFVDEERKKPIPVATPPLVRFYLHLRSPSTLQFTLSFHHAVVDGWSVATMLADLLGDYFTRIGCLGAGSAKAHPLPYRYFVFLEQEAAANKATREFWNKKIEERRYTPIPRWPRASDAPKSSGFSVRTVSCSPDISEGLQTLARSEGMRIKTLLLAVHLRVIFFLTGSPEVVTGLVSNGRPEREGGELSVGLFLNTLPYAMKLEGGSWRELIKAVGREEEEVLAHRLMPLVEMQKMTGGSALFDTDFNFVQFHVLDGTLGLPEFECLESRMVEETNFTLAVNFSIDRETSGIVCGLSFDLSRLTPEQAFLIAGYYERTLISVAQAPDALWHKTSCFSQFEKHKILAEWSGLERSHATVSSPCFVHDAVSLQAKKTPDAVALEGDGYSLSYRELNRRANRLAHFIVDRGIGKGGVVAVCMERSAGLVTALLGVLKAGAAYLPIDPSYPEERIAFMLQDAGADLVLTDENIEEALTSGNETEPAIGLASDDLAYVVYTSGSTGKPKGAEISHASLANHMEWMLREFPLAPADRFLQKTPIGFDASVLEFWAPLMSGAQLLMARPGEHADAAALANSVKEMGVSVLQAVPTLLEALLAEPDFRDAKQLRRVFAGGEALSPRLREAFFRVLPSVQFINLYGPAEATIDSTFHVFRPEESGGNVPLGRPISNAQVYVLDEWMNPVPVGARGELYIGGAGLARGYRKRPQLTEESFVANPFSDKPKDRLYRTRDLAWFDSEGRLFFAGRSDDQIKLGGVRMEPGEIKAAIESHPFVLKAEVTLHDSSSGQKELVVYAIVKTESEGLKADLRSYLKSQLPDAMIPKFIVFLKEFPLSPNGKLDKKALPFPDRDARASSHTHEEPSTDAEIGIAAVWSKVLGIPGVGRKDNFFELGGDSILSLQIVSGCLRAGWRITSKLIFEGQTLEAVAAAALRVAKTLPSGERVSGQVPLTPIQHVFFERNGNNPHHWNQSVLLETKPGFTPAALRAALEKIAAKRHALRLRYFKDGEAWRQTYIEEAPEIPLDIFDCTGMSEKKQAEFLGNAAQDIQGGLNITHGPLMRAAWFDFKEGTTGRVLFVIHHLIVDGVSWRILLDDLVSAGDGVLSDESASLKEWSQHLTEYADSAKLEKELPYWLDQERSRVKPLPADFPVNKDLNLESTAGLAQHSLSRDETALLLQVLPGKLRTRAEEVLLTAFLESVSDWSGNDTLLVDLEGHGREEIFEEVDPSRVMGWFTTLFPVLLKRNRERSPLALLKSVKETLRSVPCHGLGYGVLRYLAKDPEIASGLSRLPASEISFNYLGQFGAPAEGSFFAPARESAGSERGASNKRSHAIDFIGMVAAGELSVQWIYSGAYHRPETIQALSRLFIERLQNLLACCLASESWSYTPSDFPLAQLDQQTLDRLAGNEKIAGLYPLSPLQEGLLYHATDMKGEGLYIQQMVADFAGTMDAWAFERAWEQVIERHDILRTGFYWADLKRPLQMVRESVLCPMLWHDWRAFSLEEQEEKWAKKIADDRAAGFDLTQPPLMRVEVVRLGEESWRTLWSHHHIIIDGWSVPLLLKELFDLYFAATRKESLALPPPQQYARYIALLAAQDESAAEKYWRQFFSGFREPSVLALERPELEIERTGMLQDEAEMWLSEALTEKLSVFARSQRLTLNSVMEGMWALLLYRYSGQTDVLFGRTTSGRSMELQGMESMVGLFINTLPLRVEIPGGISLLEFLEAVQRQGIESTRYEYASLAQVQSWSQASRGVALFDTLFIFENYPLERPLGEAGDASGLVAVKIATLEKNNYPLTVYVTPGKRLHLKAAFHSNRFSRKALEHLLCHARTLLEKMVTGRYSEIAALGLTDEAEEKALVGRIAGHETTLNKGATLPGLFVEQAKKTPGRTAAVFEDSGWTYRELDAYSERFATGLIASGIMPGDRVGIYMDRSLEIIGVLLGVLKAGAAYVPLDPAFPQVRIAMMMEDGALSLIVAQAHLVERISAGGVTLMCPDEVLNRHAESGLIEALPAPEQAAYVLFTSGSTGRPKGVEVPHKALVNVLESFSRKPGLQEEDIFLAITTLSFDIAALELFLPLIVGAKLVIASKETASDGRLMARQLLEEGCTHMQATPATWRMLLASGFKPSKAIKMWCGGEALPQDLAGALVQEGGELWNLYGPTETTIWSLIQRVQKAEDALFIGSPIENTLICVVDKDLNLQPEGVPGELLIGGSGLALGYFGRPDMTGEKFIVPRWSAEKGERFYRTGDLVRQCAGGRIEFLGRMDQQVKIRGFRIEPGEIENVLARHESVAEAAVVAREDARGEKRLVAYCVLAGGFLEAVAIPVLRRELGDKLPSYMVPEVLVAIDAMPLTPNGKVDRKQLPNPDRGITKEYVPPRSQCEETLAVIWEEVLGVERVGIEEDFFEMGGHSLLATQIVSRLPKAFQVELPVRALFEARTIALLAEKIEAARKMQTASAELPLCVDASNEMPLLSFAQQRMWFLGQLEKESAAYNIAGVLRLTGSLDRAALEKAFLEITRRHDVLRTRFVEIDGKPQPIVEPTLVFHLETEDLSNLPEAERKAKIHTCIKETSERPFDLTQAPLFRARLLKVDASAEGEHLLCITIHHIVSDAWSIGIFVQELSSLYESFTAGNQPELPELSVQYADFAAWQRKWLTGETLEAQLNYWKERLDGAPPRLELPSSRPRPQVMAYRGRTEHFQIEEDLRSRLSLLCRKSGVSLFMALHAGLAVLLSRYSGKEDIVIGSPIANRNRKEIEKLIGLFVNTLPIRADLSGSPDFPELLGRVRKATLDAYDHQDIPFERLVEELQPERRLNYTPIFQVLFTLLNVPATHFELKGLKITPVELENDTTKFDLTLTMSESKKGLQGTWQYNADLFEQQEMARMIVHFKNILDEMTAPSSRTVWEAAMLTQEEAHRVLREWPKEAALGRNEEGIVRLFEAQAERNFHNQALVCAEEVLTYGELNARANQVAAYLQERGVEPETLVGVCMERSTEMIVALLGILKTGAAFVPLDPEFPKDRIDFMLADSNIAILLTQQKLLDKFPREFSGLVCLDAKESGVFLKRAENFSVNIKPENAAYVIYTSGSTGRPKGVVVEHRSLMNYLDAIEERCGIRACKSFAMVSTLAADLGFTVLFSALISGGVLHVLGKDLIADAHALGDYFDKNPVDCLKIVPGHLAALQKSDRPDAVLPNRLLILGGEAASCRWIKTLLGKVPKIINHYGPTESTIGVLTFPVSDAFLLSDFAAVPIGRPLANVEAYILDSHLAPVPEGVYGELYVGGDCLAREYLNRPELTLERFVPHPFVTAPGARLYKTGDLARWLPDGSIEYAGRVDDQVKIRGYRIEPDEIKAAISLHPSVSENVVVARQDPRGELRLIAYVVLKSGEAETLSILKTFLQERVPDYMIPSVFVVLPAIPVTPNGKVDRLALPEPKLEARVSEEKQSPLFNPVEEILKAIWCEVLGLEQIGAQENFFERGGHSLLATQVVSRVREAFGVALPVRSLFENPTIADMGKDISRMRNARDAERMPPPISSVSDKGSMAEELPLSFGQQRLWFLSRLEAEDTSYNIPAAIRIYGPLNVAALEMAVNEIVRRHEVLRTRFVVESEGSPLQIIDKERILDLRRVDLRAYSEALREERIIRIAREEAEYIFNLETEPLVRILLVQLDDEQFVFFHTMHHIVSDGWSTGILSRELSVLYDAFSQDMPSPLTELPIQYSDFGRWQRDVFCGEFFKGSLGYWKEQLRGAPSLLKLPLDRARQSLEKPVGGLEHFEIDEDVALKLKEIARQSGASLYMTLYAAFATLLYRYAKQEAIVIGTPIANRNYKEIEPLIGFFVNTLAICTNLSGNPDFREVLARVRETSLDAYEHQDVPFEKLVEELEPDRNLSHSPLFQVMFDWQNASGRRLELRGLAIEPLELEYAIAKFDLTLTMGESSSGMYGDFEYNARLFDAETIAIMRLKFIRLLEQIVQESTIKISDYDLLLPVEKELNTLLKLDIEI